jgi:predicted GH43/DUF377 family glycosyl hydrolase
MNATNYFRQFILVVLSMLMAVLTVNAQQPSANQRTQHMFFGDTTRIGVPFAKDPHVIKVGGRYLMYYSIPAYKDEANPIKGWGIGIAESKNLSDWKKIGEITPVGDYEKKGMAAPSAMVHKGMVHLFYQTYGNWTNDALCHAWSADGIHFTRNETNPIFKPNGTWNAGRAIDAEIVKFKDKFLLYYATRDPEMKVQMIGVASAPISTNFNREDWTNLSVDGPLLKPQYPWEETCIEGASVVEMDGTLFMFYAGAYNNRPQQIGVAKSSDGLAWERLSNKPFLENGEPGTWNACESGHPHLFKDDNGKTYLFYQGNNDFGKTWYISNLRVNWRKGIPFIKK